MALMTSPDGPLGPGFLPPPGEYSSRYLRFFTALWNESRVEGLMIIAALTIRMGFRNNDQKPSKARSCVERLGAFAWTDCELSVAALVGGFQQ